MTKRGEQDLSALSPKEREFLSLLGRGHTAKSIAALHAVSEAAVNERFRSARRKTGVASSREIARLIVAQENRHDFIDLVPTSAMSSDAPRPDTPRRASLLRRWSLPMLASGLLAIAILAHQTSAPTPTLRPNLPPALQSLFAPSPASPDVVALHQEVSTGAPDPAWSSQAKAALSRTYRGVADPSDAITALEIACNASLCEVLAASRDGISPAEVNNLIEAFQSPDVIEAARVLNLEPVIQGFHSSRDDSMRDGPSTFTFVAYWRRTDGA